MRYKRLVFELSHVIFTTNCGILADKTVVTPSKATEKFRNKDQIRQFLPHTCELYTFLPHLSFDFGTNKATIALFGIALFGVTTVSAFSVLFQGHKEHFA